MAAGLVCFAWALVGWLAVVPNQDILVDGIQAQSLIADPRMVLSFPGQKHGGPLEYPATVLAEWLAPGNYFANAAIRPVLAFFTGLSVALLFLRLFPTAPRWGLLGAMAVGPTIIHGLLGPEGNPVGVWWLQPNWDMAWLLVTVGMLGLARAAAAWGRPRARGTALLGGLCIGLGFYAHPAISLLIGPLLVLVLLRIRPTVTSLLWAVPGLVLGVAPAAISYVVNARVNTWDPSHGAFIAISYYRDMGGAILGLDGVPDYIYALLPYAVGLAPSDTLLSGVAKSVAMWILVISVITVSVLAVIRSIRLRRWPGPGGALALAWLSAMLTMFAFITFIDPVWIYSSGLAILFWLSVGALPVAFGRKTVGVFLAACVIALTAASTLSHNWSYLSSLPTGVAKKADAQSDSYRLAEALLAKGAEVVYGSYYDAVPVGYASGLKLRTITNTYNRFPLSEGEMARGQWKTAVNTSPSDQWGRDALERVSRMCRPIAGTRPAIAPRWSVFDCPASALTTGAGEE